MARQTKLQGKPTLSSQRVRKGENMIGNFQTTIDLLLSNTMDSTPTPIAKGQVASSEFYPCPSIIWHGSLSFLQDDHKRQDFHFSMEVRTRLPATYSHYDIREDHVRSSNEFSFPGRWCNQRPHGKPKLPFYLGTFFQLLRKDMMEYKNKHM